MSEKKILHLNYKVENAAECEDLNNKNLITEQEVNVFVEEQQNPNEQIWMSASLLNSFIKNHLVWRKEV